MYSACKPILLLLFVSGSNTEAILCIEENKAISHFSVKCPMNSNIHVLKISGDASSMYIDCDKLDIQINTFEMELNLSVQSSYIFIRNCPLPPNGFQGILTKLKFINMERLYNITDLTISNSTISISSEDSFKKFYGLRNIILVNNKLEFHDEMFKHALNLTVLEIKGNYITNIPQDSFKGLLNLEILRFVNNHNIKAIRENIFDDLVNLQWLDLTSNGISELDHNSFKSLGKLMKINLGRNQLHHMPNDIFKHCVHLHLINLEYNEIEILPQNVFSGSRKLSSLILDKNQLEILPENIFENLTQLFELSLSNNRLENLSDRIFSSQKKLSILNLDHNCLKIISRNIFARLGNLKKLDLSYNMIKVMERTCFHTCYNLVEIRMNHNLFEFEGHLFTAPFNLLPNLKLLDLGYNKISHYLYDLPSINRFANPSTQFHTKSLYVNLEHNIISMIRPNLNFEKADSTIITINITGNPIFCDCQALALKQYLIRQNERKELENKYQYFTYSYLHCAGPSILKNISFEDVQMENLTCDIATNCVKGDQCECSYRPSDNTVIVSCANKNLSTIPEFILQNVPEEIGRGKSYQYTELNMERNFLTNLTETLKNYTNLRKLFLQYNNIDGIQWIPPSLKVLNIQNNKFHTMNRHFLEELNKSEITKLYLGNNPWNCDCSTSEFQHFLRDYSGQIDDNNIRCSASGQLLKKMSENDLCPVKIGLELVVFSVLLGCLFVLTATAFLCYMYKQEILIWLYARGSCLWLIQEERIDKNKKYDIFISFASQDEEFVTNNLVPQLERGTPSYKLCIHVRDWIPGVLIPTQITNSVRDSRRTLVVLSSHFLKSIWGKLEFRTAHTEAMREGRVRVIIMIYGAIDMGSLDDELKAYIKTNTYIKWGDPWFWEKLRYALPRTRRRHNKMTEMIYEGKYNLISD